VEGVQSVSAVTIAAEASVPALPTSVELTRKAILTIPPPSRLACARMVKEARGRRAFVTGWSTQARALPEVDPLEAGAQAARSSMASRMDRVKDCCLVIIIIFSRPDYGRGMPINLTVNRQLIVSVPNRSKFPNWSS